MSWLKIAGLKYTEPIKVGPETFNDLDKTLEYFSEIDPNLEVLETIGDKVGIVTDGERFIGIQTEGYKYPRYKTKVTKSIEEIKKEAESDNWRRKDEDENYKFESLHGDK